MEIYLQEPDSRFQLVFGGIISQLMTVIHAPSRTVLLCSNAPLDELEEMAVAMGLLREWERTAPIWVVTPAPTLGWWQRMRAAGSGRQLVLTSTRYFRATCLALSQMQDIVSEPCPNLRLMSGERVGSISVCGDGKNRLVLAFHHYQRWCLADYATCPYWKRGSAPRRWAAEWTGFRSPYNSGCHVRVSQ